MNNITVISYCHSAHAKWIPHWVEQLKKQTFQDFDIVFVFHNWEGTSGLGNPALYMKKEFGDRIRFFDHCGPPVIGDVIDFAASKVETEWLAHWDMDDNFHSKRLEVQNNFIESHDDIDFINARCIGFSDTQPNVGLFYHDKSSDILEYLTDPQLNDNYQIKSSFMKGLNPLAHGLMCYKPETLKAIGGFSRSDVKVDGKSPDFETWKKALNAGYKFYRLPELLMYWRLNSSSIRN